MTLDEPGIRHQRGSLCRCLGETWTAPTPRPTRPQRGQPHVDGPLGGAFLIPRPLAVVDYSIVEPDAAWLVWILQAQLQDDVFRAGRLDSDEAAKHPPETQRSQRTWSRFRSSSLAECLLCRSRAV